MPALITRPGAVSQPTSGRTALGMVLVALGIQWFLKAAIGFHVTLWLLALGAVVLQRWFTLRHHAALVFGGVLVGVGLAEIVQDVIPGRQFDDFVGFLGWAFGFLLVASLGGRGSRWAYPVAAGFGIAAVGSLGLALGRFLPESLASLSLPLFVLVAGVLLLSKGRGRHRLLMVVLAAACLLFASSLSDSYREIRSGPLRTATVQLPDDLRGKTLFVDDVRTVKITQSSSPRGVAIARTGGDDLRPEIHGDTVEFSQPGVQSYDLRVPAGTNVKVRATGSVHVKLDGGSVDIVTDNGGVVVDGTFTELDVHTENGPILGSVALIGDGEGDIHTDNGDIELDLAGDPELDVESDNGIIRVDGDDEGADYDRDGADGAGELSISSGNGSVQLTRAAAGLR